MRLWKRLHRRVLDKHRTNRCWCVVWYLLFIATLLAIYTSRASVDFPGYTDYPAFYSDSQTVGGGAGFVPVIIIGYMRSGSSLTADFIQQNTNVFYVFEPLHEVERDYMGTMEAVFPNLKFSGKRTTMAAKDEMLNVLRAWFTCNLKFILEKETRSVPQFLQYGTKTNTFKECLKGMSATGQQYSKQCTSLLLKFCLDSKYRLVKSIRINLKWLYELFDEFPTLRVIHLLRDPRAIIESQSKFAQCYGRVPECSYNLCKNMEEDLLSYEILKKLYPKRLYRLYFEDIALNPVSVTKQVYDYLGLELHSAVKDYIINATSAGNKPTGIMSTIRENSTDVIYRWRRNLKERDLQQIQTMCWYVMEKMSYHHFIKP